MVRGRGEGAMQRPQLTHMMCITEEKVVNSFSLDLQMLRLSSREQPTQ